MTCDTPDSRRNTEGALVSGYRIVCFGDEQWHYEGALQRMARELAAGNELIYVNSIGVRPPRLSIRDAAKVARRLRSWASEKSDGSYPRVVHPLTLPLYNFSAGVNVSGTLVYDQLARAGVFDSDLQLMLWVGVPTAAPIVAKLGGVPYFQHATDCQSAYPGVKRNVIAALEEELARNARFCVTASQKMAERLARLNPRTVWIEHSVDYEAFQRPFELPDDLSSLPPPILGYVGGITSWFDQDAIAEVATHFPTASIVLIGAESVSTARVRRFENVHILGPKPYSDIPAYINSFDVCLLPRKCSDWQIYANPLVMMEYFGSGKPVVSVDLPFVNPYRSLIHTYRSGESPLNAINSALNEAGGLGDERREIARCRQHPASSFELSRCIEQYIGDIEERSKGNLPR